MVEMVDGWSWLPAFRKRNCSSCFWEPNDAIPQLLETVNRGEVGNKQKQCCLSLNDANSTPKPRSGFA